MHRYFAAVFTSNHRDSTSAPGATSLDSMAYLHCFGRGLLVSGVPVRSALGASAGKVDKCGRPRCSATERRSAHWARATPNEARATRRSAAIVCAGEPRKHALGGARALLRAVRRGDEARGEDSMLTPDTRGRQGDRRTATHGNSGRMFAGWQLRRGRCDTPC
jgi:hypothetical protein